MSIPDESRGLQIEFRRVIEDGSSSPVNDVAVNADSTEFFQVVCRINNIGDFGKLTTISVSRWQGSSFQTLALMQNVDDTETDSYRKPFLSQGGSGWTAVGEYASNSRDSYVGVARQLSSVSCNEAISYRCDVAYTAPAPGFQAQNGAINKTLSVRGNSVFFP